MRPSKFLLIVSLTFFLVSNIHAQTKVESADQIVKEAKAEASKTNKNNFLIFLASWCIWCHRMDSAMNDESIRNFFKKSYVIEHLTIDESNDKKYLENPGAAALLTKYHGDRQGIPYWVILDKNGNFLADSRLEANGKTGNSVGCPAK